MSSSEPVVTAHTGSKVRLTEPSTTATDALLASATLAFALDLARRRPPRAARGTYYAWTFALAASGGAAAAGAVSHGAKALGDGSLSRAAWTLALRASGIAGTFLAAGAAMDQPEAARRARNLASIAVRQATFQGRVSARSPFRSAVLAYGIDTTSAVRLLAPHARGGNRSAMLALGSIGLTVVGGAVQQAGWGRGRLLNNNDRFHLLQLGSSTLLYLAARQLGEDASRGLASSRAASAHQTGPVTPNASPARSG